MVIGNSRPSLATNIFVLAPARPNVCQFGGKERGAGKSCDYLTLQKLLKDFFQEVAVVLKGVVAG